MNIFSISQAFSPDADNDENQQMHKLKLDQQKLFQYLLSSAYNQNSNAPSLAPCISSPRKTFDIDSLISTSQDATSRAPMAHTNDSTLKFAYLSNLDAYQNLLPKTNELARLAHLGHSTPFAASMMGSFRANEADLEKFREFYSSGSLPVQGR